MRSARIALLTLALAGSVTACSRAAHPAAATADHAQLPSGTTRPSPGSGSLRYPAAVTWYGGPLLSLPDTGAFDWVCTGRTGSTRRFHVRYTATTNEHVAVVERHAPPRGYQPEQPGATIEPPAQRPGWQAWHIRFGGENGTTTVRVRFLFAVVGGACTVERTTARRRFAPTAG